MLLLLTGTRAPNNTQLALGLGLSLGLAGLMLLFVLVWGCRRYWSVRKEADTKRRAAAVAAVMAADSKQKTHFKSANSSSSGVAPMTSHKSATTSKHATAAAMAAGLHGQGDIDWTTPSGAQSPHQGASGSLRGIPHPVSPSAGSQASGMEHIELEVTDTASNGPSSGRKLRSHASVAQAREYSTQLTDCVVS